MNHLTWLKIDESAVSDSDTGAELFTYGELGSTTTHLPYDGEPRHPTVSPLGVRTVRLDDCVHRGELRPPHFVKIDVEGHAHRALTGMRETLATALPTLIVGFHSAPERDGVLAHLLPLRYVARRIGETHVAADILVGSDYLFTPPS